MTTYAGSSGCLVTESYTVPQDFRFLMARKDKSALHDESGVDSSVEATPTAAMVLAVVAKVIDFKKVLS